jgi:hypothetical protein
MGLDIRGGLKKRMCISNFKYGVASFSLKDWGKIYDTMSAQASIRKELAELTPHGLHTRLNTSEIKHPLHHHLKR